MLRSGDAMLRKPKNDEDYKVQPAVIREPALYRVLLDGQQVIKPSILYLLWIKRENPI